MAIGTGWVDGAWVDAGWVTAGDGAWSQVTPTPAEGAAPQILRFDWLWDKWLSQDS